MILLTRLLKLFVDDWPLAGGALVWTGLCALADHLGLAAAWTGPAVFTGAVILLGASILAAARKS